MSYNKTLYVELPLAKVNHSLERLGTIGIQEAFAIIKAAVDGRTKVMVVNGHEANPGSQRYELFMKKGTTCVCCGLKAQFFAIERHYANSECRAHLNLYGIDDAGDEVLFTKDHIVPKAKGGQNFLSNYQTMCMPCNTEKGSKDQHNAVPQDKGNKA
jgi:5-methylcytosine-specific restriction endonuclease McrA